MGEVTKVAVFAVVRLGSRIDEHGNGLLSVSVEEVLPTAGAADREVARLRGLGRDGSLYFRHHTRYSSRGSGPTSEGSQGEERVGVPVSAVVRLDQYGDEGWDGVVHVTVKEILHSEIDPGPLVARLNALNGERGAAYFWQSTVLYPSGRG